MGQRILSYPWASRPSAIHLSMHAVQVLMSCVHSAVGACSGKENEGDFSV